VTSEAQATTATPVQALAIVSGEQIYVEHCTRCHGETGHGDGELVTSGQVTKPADFTDPQTTVNVQPEDWYNIITNGNLEKLMPPWKDSLTDDERWAVTMYVYNLAKTQSLITGLVSGSVVNATAGGQLPSALSLELHIIDQGFTEEETLRTVMNPDGTFRIDDVPLYANKNYVVTTEYQGGLFASELQAGDPSAGKLNFSLPIYEFTDDPDVVQIDNITAQVSIDNDTLTMIGLVSFINTSDRAFRSADGTSSVHISLPEGAQPSRLITESARYRYSESTRQIIDTYPVMPGESHSVHLIYTLPYRGRVDIRQPLDYPLAKGLEILVDSSDIDITGKDIQPLGQRTTPQGVLMGFGTRSAFPAGADLAFTISSNTGGAQTIRQPPPVLPLIFIGAGIVTVIVAGVLHLRRRQRSRLVNAPVSNLQVRIDALIREIAALDENYQAGKIKGEAYELQRHTLKSELAQLMKLHES
jgi:hypothetical protein